MERNIKPEPIRKGKSFDEYIDDIFEKREKKLIDKIDQSFRKNRLKLKKEQIDVE